MHYTFWISFNKLYILCLSSKTKYKIFYSESNDCQNEVKIFQKNMHYDGFSALESMCKQNVPTSLLQYYIQKDFSWCIWVKKKALSSVIVLRLSIRIGMSIKNNIFFTLQVVLIHVLYETHILESLQQYEGNLTSVQSTTTQDYQTM